MIDPKLLRAVPGEPFGGRPTWHGRWRHWDGYWRVAVNADGLEITYASPEAAVAGARVCAEEAEAERKGETK